MKRMIPEIIIFTLVCAFSIYFILSIASMLQGFKYGLTTHLGGF